MRDLLTKRRLIVIGVISVVVIALVVTAVVLLTTKSDDEESFGPTGPTLSIDDFLGGKLTPKTFNATWASGKDLLFTDSDGNLILHTIGAESRVQNVILDREQMISGGTKFERSADQKYLKVAHDIQKVYRHSYTAKYTIINLENFQKFELRIGDHNEFLLAEWSTVGNAIAIVLENNIYYKSSVESEDYNKITDDGEYIYNGIPDWVYEEEIFSSNKALWFSPDGEYLIYGTFDDTDVTLMTIPYYGEPGSLDSQYTQPKPIKYPKAGTPNPTVTLRSIYLSGDYRADLSPPDALTENSEIPILSTVSWIDNGKVLAIWMNRIQNEVYFLSYNVSLTSASWKIVHSLNTSGWFEPFTTPIYYSRDNTNFALIVPIDQGSNLGSFRHVALLSLENDEIEPLTSGTFVVTKILGWNHDHNKLYYLANTANDPSVQHLYSVSPETKENECLSCEIKSKNKQVNCLYNSAEFSKDASYYVLTCAGPDVPDIAIYTAEGEKILEWLDNEELQEITENKELPETLMDTFDLSDGFKAQVYLKLPPKLDRSGRTKYPMLVNVYAGPDSFQVVQRFNLGWGGYLASSKNIIYAVIDGRGSSLKGDDMMFALYKKLGTVEIEDQISVTKKIQDKYKYVDANKTAVWGSSYGGYAAGMILSSDNSGIFKCGMSVAPVTDWTLYDTMYTERYMGLPTIDDNLQGYDNGNLLSKYEGLRDKQYFLIHGTYDDNVHYQQSMLWSRVLERQDILFTQAAYPDETHSFGASVQPHFYHSMEKFLDECFA